MNSTRIKRYCGVLSEGYNPIIHDTRAVIRFLKKLRRHGPWTLTAIRPDGIAGSGNINIETRTFTQNQIQEMHEWIAFRNLGSRWNIYYHINPTITPMSKKASKTDVWEVIALQVDGDPRDNKPLNEEQKRIRTMFETRQPGTPGLPTAIIFSGGGYQGLFVLTEAAPIDGDVDAAAEIERRTRHLEEVYGGDSTHSVEHIFRLPGTVNWPHEKKRARGQQPTWATLIEWVDSRTYDLNQFEKAVPLPAKVKTNGPKAKWRKIKSLDVLDKWRISDLIKKIIREGRDRDNPKEADDSRSAWLYQCVCSLVKLNVPDSLVLGIITDKKWKISESVLDKQNVPKYALHQLNSGKAALAVYRNLAVKVINKSQSEDDNERQKRIKAAAGNVIDPRNFLACAEAFRKVYRPNVMYYNEDCYDYDSTTGAYRVIEEQTIRSELYLFLNDCQKHVDGGQTGPIHPSKTLVNNVVDALHGIAHIEAEKFHPPVWLKGRHKSIEAMDMLVCRNGLLHIPTRQRYDHTPDLFTGNVVDVAYEEDAPEPREWFAFLKSLFPDSDEEIALLQEIFGYLLTNDTRQQKIFLIIGPTRAGKGTIGRIMIQLIGPSNTCSPNIRALGKDFGMMTLIDKKLALMSDVRLDKNLEAIAENLLRLTGDDDINIPRKYKGDWVGKPGVRFVMLTNEFPQFDDVSGALPNRFIPMVLTESFFDREDLNLGRKLQGELPGILNWALDGLERLEERGRFHLPQTSLAARDELITLGAPIAAFVNQKCELDAEYRITKGNLFTEYKTWCKEEELPRTSAGEFFKGLRKAFPKVQPKRVLVKNKNSGVVQRVHKMLGIRVRSHSGIG